MATSNQDANENTKRMLQQVLLLGKVARTSMLKRGASFVELRDLDEEIATCEKTLAELTEG